MSFQKRTRSGLVVVPELSDLEEAESEGVWHPVCPKCGGQGSAEPDADRVVCNDCDREFAVVPTYLVDLD